MRRANDKYDTPSGQVHALVSPLVDLLGNSLRGVVIEPCAGDGNLALAIVSLANISRLEPFDIVSENYRFDATNQDDWYMADRGFGNFDWTITNPPFNLALPILENAWEFSQIGVAFLLPISWNEPVKDRREWLLGHADNLRYIIPVCPRPHFRKGEINPKTGKEYGTDPRTVAWYVWRKDWSWAEMGIKCPFQYLAGWR